MESLPKLGLVSGAVGLTGSSAPAQSQLLYLKDIILRRDGNSAFLLSGQTVFSDSFHKYFLSTHLVQSILLDTARDTRIRYHPQRTYSLSLKLVGYTSNISVLILLKNDLKNIKGSH